MLLTSKHWPWRIFPSPSRSNHPRHSWTQRSWKINPDQGHARTSPHSGKVLLNQKDIGQALQRVATSNKRQLLISTSPSRCESVSHWASTPIFLFSSEKAKRISKSRKCLELVNLLDLADRQIGRTFRRAIPTGPNRPLLGSRSRGHLFG